ncbi:cytochrome-c oxidase, cbb3-type subunit III [Reinekea blandensis]|uniref:Cbb3-type cytochrome c oxidase subunit n=1 Tax=Reinekea blandensis MED297 TaxID=314283 RepID=A4BCM2_9GAMM|nr:cytochrome-c oxidase, cbb3-type subunit III [Reinekea blandensis]EAR10288.1 cytochrome c oxidase, cbb3-type, subunit III [Reinekea sp. MED297] [Reinekea blandensis MED297]
MSTFWSAYIFALTGITILGLVALIFLTRRMPGSSDPEETTGHSFDGIEEYNKPMPKWWLNMFWITIFFGIGYLAWYGIGNYKGLGNWSSAGQLAAETAAHEERYGEIFERFAQIPVEELKDNPQAVRMGQQIFINNCALCHGQTAQGYYGFPNLTDDDWLYGGSGEQIKTSLIQGRRGQMPAWKDTLGSTGVAAVTEYVLELSGNEHNAELAANGEVIYSQMCSACHGPDGTGNIALGAPNLTDNIWLYDNPELDLKQDITLTLNNGRAGNMPAWEDILGSEKVHLLAGYVYSLSHGAR